MKSHLACTSHENFAIRCYLFNVLRPNEEDLQEFPLIYLSNVISCGLEVRFEKSCCVHLHENFGVVEGRHLVMLDGLSSHVHLA